MCWAGTSTLSAPSSTPALDERTVGLGLDRLRAASTAIAVIAGEAKHRVAHAVVSSGLCTILVTDEATALSVLRQQVLGQKQETA